MGVIAKGIPRGCQGLFNPVSLGYPLSVFNKNSTLERTNGMIRQLASQWNHQVLPSRPLSPPAGLRPPLRNAELALPSHSHPYTNHPDCLDELTTTHSAQLHNRGNIPARIWHSPNTPTTIMPTYQPSLQVHHQPHTFIATHLYHIRRRFRLSNCHPRQSIEIRTEDAHTLLAIKGMYTNPYTPSQVAQAIVRNIGKSFAHFLKPLASAVWHKDINRNHPFSQDTLPSTARTRAYFTIMSSSFIRSDSSTKCDTQAPRPQDLQDNSILCFFALLRMIPKSQP